MRTPSNHHPRTRMTWLPLIPLALAAVLVLGTFAAAPWHSAQAAGVLTVTIEAGYNLVVDSNVLAPSTEAPEVATVMGKFCNTGDQNLTGVQGYIGDYIAAGTSTPGVYPKRWTDDTGFGTQYPHLMTASRTYYSFTHIGGAAGLADASRYIGTLTPGQCITQYWHFTYPRRSNLNTSLDNLGPEAVWGVTHDPFDDLKLYFDVWGTSAESINGDATWGMTMRNEISAMANKIYPSGSTWTSSSGGGLVEPGDLVTISGVNYTLGAVNKGFDNDLTLFYDYNAWLQPVGDRDYDPGCFRLVGSNGTLDITRTGGYPNKFLTFTDHLYFTHPEMPHDNTGTLGTINYIFMAVGGPCTSALSPYQEAASGADNEKFNGDYGTGVPPLQSSAPALTLDKSGPATASLGDIVNYTINFQNTSYTKALGRLDLGMPLVLSDTIPAGTKFNGTVAFSPLGAADIWYSVNYGQTWVNTQPSPASNVTTIQWRMNRALASRETATATYSVQVDSTWTQATPEFVNKACIGFGSASPMLCDDVPTLVSGNLNIGDFVWKDMDWDGVQDGSGAGETGINGVTVKLYYDRNGNGVYDPSVDMYLNTATTDANGAYLFQNYPGSATGVKYVVVVDKTTGGIPTLGYAPTTVTTRAVTLIADNVLTADFGFGPPITAEKVKVTSGSIYDTQLVTYNLNVTSKHQSATCQYTTWGSIDNTGTPGHGWVQANKAWFDRANALGAPDGPYAYTMFSNVADYIDISGWDIPQHTGNITKVELLFAMWASAPLATTSPDYVTGAVYCENDTVSKLPTVDIGKSWFDSHVGQANQGIYAWTVYDGPGGVTDVDLGICNSSSGWAWSLFQPAFNLDGELSSHKVGQKDGPNIYLDAMGYRVTSDGTCDTSGGSNTIVTVPLDDRFDNTRFDLVSTDPPYSRLSVSGSTTTIIWDNVGPLYGGQTKTATVVLRAKNSPTGCGDVLDYLDVAGAKYSDGRPANDVTNVSATTNTCPGGTIGDLVWVDGNGSGYWDSGEAGFSGVTVRLIGNPGNNCSIKAGSTTVDQVTTAGIAYGGSIYNYLFTGLPDGTYCVRLPNGVPTGWTQTADPTSPWPCSGNNCDVYGPDITISGGTVNRAQDFGFRYSTANRAIIYGNVFEDVEGDGYPFETGDNILNATVRLYTSGGTLLDTVSTSNGYYQFIVDTSSARTYYVEVDTTTIQPSGPTWTQTYDPDVIGQCTQGVNCNNRRDSISIPAGDRNAYGAYDFGYHRSGVYDIGDTVYYDWNGDGVKQTTEEGIPNITLILYEDEDQDGVVDVGVDGEIARTTTDSNGVYWFYDRYGTTAGVGYIVQVNRSGTSDPLAGFTQTGDPDQPGGTCSTCDNKGKVTLHEADIDTIDFGYQPRGTATIGDFVWRDLDRDGVQDGGLETGIADIKVSLYHDQDNNNVYDSAVDDLVGTTETDAFGYYHFYYLPIANYVVAVDRSDIDLPVNSDGNYWDVTTAATLARDITTAGQVISDADFGFAPYGLIGDRIWRDDNGDGYQDGGEPGIAGVTVYLRSWTDANDNGLIDSGELGGVLSTTTTDYNGIYQFNRLGAGSYAVEVGSGVPSGWTQTYDPDNMAPCGTCDAFTGVKLATAQVDRSNDFGYRPALTVGDTLWIDSDNDHTRDATEAGLRAISVGLYLDDGDNVFEPAGGVGGDELIITTTTSLDGTYYFSRNTWVDGRYWVRAQPADVTKYYPGLGATWDPDGSADQLTTFRVQSNVVTEVPYGTTCSNCNLNVDFAYRYGSLQLSGTVFYDTGNNGYPYNYPADPTDPDTPFEGVTVYLVKVDALGNRTVVDTATTNSSGLYTFNGLAAGTYEVDVEQDNAQLFGLTQTYDPTSGQPNPCTTCDGKVTVTLVASNVTDQDFGYYSNLDWGDLPQPSATGTPAADNYMITTRQNQGAAHIVSSLYLGASRDTELDGQPSADASGDGGDENGIAPTTDSYWWSGTGSVQVTVTGGPGLLSAWIDWNGDGDFNDAKEHILSDYRVNDGTQTVTFSSPTDNTAKPVFARFRLYPLSAIGTVGFQGVVNGGEVEDYYWTAEQTPVTLSYFRVSDAGDGKLHFKWTTSLEVGNLGFQLYAYTPDGAVMLNEGLIPSQSVDALSPQDYEYTLAWDRAADAKGFYLADVDIFGRARMHGPFAMNEDYGAQVKPEPIDWAAIQAAHAAQVKGRAPVQAYSAGQKVNLQVRTTGLYRVTYEQLKAAGFDWAGANAQYLALTSRGRRVPITVSCGAVFAPGCYVEFYGEALDTLYTDTNVYTLLVDRAQALRIAVDGSAINPSAVPPAYYMETATFGLNRHYDFAAPGNDPWYDTQMLVYQTPLTRTFAANIDAYVAGAAPATLGVDMWGGTDWPQSPDHHIVVRFNGTTVADDLYNGLESHPVQATLPAGLLHTGANTLQLVQPGDTGVPGEITTLNSYRITYPRAPIARDGRLTFKAAGRVMRVEGLPTANVVVYRLNALGTPVRISQVRVESTGATYRATFPGTITGQATYVVSTVQAVRAPAVTAARPAVDIKSGTAQYLVIAHGDFVAGIQPLVAYHQGQGMTTRVVDVADVYAQFGYGIFGPQAIRDYIRYAVTNMGTQYVLLVGGDTYDYRNYLGYGSLSFMPSLYARTDWIVAYAPVDTLYADVDGDNVPEVALGRLPVRTNDELSVLIAKTLAYAAKDYGRTGVFAADATDGGLVFMNDSEAFVAQLPAGWNVQKAYIDVSGLAGARATLLNAMNGGVALTSYVGHSDIDIWSFSGLFTTADATALTNAGRPTVVTQWGCWNTYYVSPVYNTLAHKFLLSGDRGAAAVLGASAMTEAASEHSLGVLVMPRLTQPGMSMGAAVMDAKAQLALTNPGLLDVLLGWTLLGDPALVVTP